MRLKRYLIELSMKAKTQIDRVKKVGEYYNAEITLSDGTTWLYNAESYDRGKTFIIVFYERFDKPNKLDDKHKVALETFAAVEQLTKEFIQWQKPREFSFTSVVGSRSKLYDLLAKRIIKSGKYTMEKNSIAGGVQYTFKKVVK